MEIAKLTSKGQITIPDEVRHKLNLQAGNRVIFIEHGESFLIVNENKEKLKLRDEQISATPKKGWSKEFLTAFSRFGETSDETFVEAPEIPWEYNAPREEFD